MQGANMRVARAAARAAERNGRPLDPAYLGTASQNYETAKAVAGVPLTKYVERRNRGRVNPYSRKPGSY
jgi:hypothetical protein